MNAQIENRNLIREDVLRKRVRGIDASKDYSTWSYEDKIIALELYMEGRSWAAIAEILGSRTDDTRMIRGIQRIIQKMRSNYSTTKPRANWRARDRWIITINRAGKPVTVNERKWVQWRLRYGKPTVVFPGVSWTNIAEETGRPISEAKKLFGSLALTKQHKSLF